MCGVFFFLISPPFFFHFQDYLFRSWKVFTLSKIYENNDLWVCLCLWGQPKDFCHFWNRFLKALSIPDPIKFKRTYMLQVWARALWIKTMYSLTNNGKIWGFGSWNLFAWSSDPEHYKPKQSHLFKWAKQMYRGKWSSTNA